ncbi:MAG TPA: glycosyltransferase [Chitinophagales bacterium]|nr:glycosyltransferase [Chitinophagales bacterium]HRP39022.1 glycosyltransferase [Chitinophagales bacterium]
MSQEIETFNGLWIGNKLSLIELLTIQSFLSFGYHFKLWIYEPLQNDLPEKVELCNANEIIPHNQIFYYKNKSQFGIGKGSVAGFSDIFRYKLLYEHGGWWVDMDITCLKKIDFAASYFFRNHHNLKVVGNVMKCPKHSVLMKHCYEEATATIDEHNTDWHKPIDILVKHIELQQLENFIVKDCSNTDMWHDTSRFIFTNEMPPQNWQFIHWQNEEWRSRNLSKSVFYPDSFLEKLLVKYGLYKKPETFLEKLKCKILLFNIVRRIKKFV